MGDNPAVEVALVFAIVSILDFQTVSYLVMSVYIGMGVPSKRTV